MHLSVAAATNDGTPIDYQWYHNGIALENAGSNTLSVSNTSLSQAGEYQVVLKAGEITEQVSATVRVLEPVIATEIHVVSSPSSRSIEEGESVNFSIVAETNDGMPISYTWFHNGQSLSNAYSSALSIAQAELDDAGDYQVVLSAGDVTRSFGTSLTVTERVIPTEITIVSPLESSEVEEGEYAMFNLVATSNDGSSLTYAWFFNGGEISGASKDFYSIEQSGAQHAGQYSVVVAAGEVSKTVSATLNVVEPELPPFYPIEISLQPSSLSAYVDESLTLNVSAVSEQPMAYQWRKNGEDIAGAQKAYLDLAALSLSDAAQYDVVITNGTDIVVSHTANIAVQELPNVQLSWSLPTEREDGEQLLPEEISGFSIYVSEEGSSEESKVGVDGLATAHDVGRLQRGRYEFSIATVDVDGIEGARSDTILVSVD